MSVKDKLQTMDYEVSLESRAAADTWLDGHKRRFGHFIGGKWVKPAKAQMLPSFAPATGEVLAEIAVGTKAEVTAATKAARAAQKDWAKTSGHKRAAYLRALARLIEKHAGVLAILEALDNGKPIRETTNVDIPASVQHFDHHAGWAELIEAEFPGHEPVGVAGQIIPWNFPLLMVAWKVAPALAAGNTIVLKPAEFTSLTALYFAELVIAAGLPDGVVNIVTGPGETGALLVDADVDKIAFTGSTEVGKLIRRQIAGTGKHLTLELGGKSPFIVFDDADLDAAADGLADAIWFNQGESCCAGSRLLVQEGIAGRFLEKVKARMAAIRIGHSLDKTVDMGAIVDPVQFERIKRMVAEGTTDGAKVWHAPCALPAEGCYYPPTLVTGAGTANILMQEEVFGPVLSVLTFRTQKEAVALANNSRYGLAASVWSETVSRALEVASALKAGAVWVNGASMFDASVGFGGMRESGFGREGGREGMTAYLVPKAERKLKDLKAEATQVGAGNPKDIDAAVEAAAGAQAAWAAKAAAERGTALRRIAETLEARADDFARKLEAAGNSRKAAKAEVATAIRRLFTAAALADKFDGIVHTAPLRGVAFAMNEPFGVLGVACPPEPLLIAPVTLTAHALAAGNAVVLVPGAALAGDMKALFAGLLVNVVTGDPAANALLLARHAMVDALWSFTGDRAAQEAAAADNMKRTWMGMAKVWDWKNGTLTSGKALMERATEVKNIWVPWGDQN